MELPFTIVFEPPSRSELRAVLRLRWTWVACGVLMLAVGSSLVLLGVGQAATPADAQRAPLSVESTPAGAVLRIDGQVVGVAPATIDIAAGVHQIALERADALGTHYALTTDGESPLTFSARLWRRQPLVQRIRAVVPGASLSDVRILADGDLVLVVSAGRDPILRAWRLTPRSGGTTELSPAWPGDRMAISADATQIALIGRDLGPASNADMQSAARRSRIVWLGSVGQPAFTQAWRAPIEDQESVTDASWSPAADKIIVVTARHVDDGHPQSRVWLLDPRTLDGRVILTLPSEVVVGTTLWSPSGERAAFVAHGGTLNALCLLDVRDGQFRYLADLAPSSTGPLPYPVGAWSQDSQRFLFVAPQQPRVGDSLAWPAPAAIPRQRVLVARTLDREPEQIGDTDANFLVWREDGQLLGIVQPSNDGPLQLRLIDSSEPHSQLVDIPLRPSGSYAPVWDLQHAELLLAEGNSTHLDVSLVTLGLEAPQ